MTPQTVFLYPGQIIYGFFLSLFGIPSYGTDTGWHLLFTVFLALLVWAKLYRAVLMIIQRITGFEGGTSK